MVDILRNPTNEDLVKAIHYNMRDLYLQADKAPRVEYMREPDATYIISDNGWYRRVEVTNFTSETADKRINDIIAAYASRNKSFTWSINPSDKPDDLASRLENAKLKRTESPGMATEIKDLRMPKCPDGLVVERVKSVKEVDAFARLTADAYPLNSESYVEFCHFLCRFEESYCYIGYLDGRPVATAYMFLGAGVAGLYAIATLPSVRGKGIGSYMTVAPLLDANEKGYEVSILHSSKMGFPVYERLGYKEICKKVGYSWRPPPATP